MPSCFFILMRFWLRIDNVLFRNQDVRIYHEFGKNYLIREVSIGESPFKTILQVLNN